MSRRFLVPAALLAATVVTIFFWPPRTKNEPSVLLIVIDSLRADHVGAYGYPRETTPFIDRLAGSGILFENAVSQAPWTKPSVASLFTSTYPSVHGVLFSKERIEGEERTDVLSDDFVTLAEVLHSAGFATAAFGQKIHLRPPNGFDQGFEAFDMSSRQAPKINRKALRWLRRSDPDRFFIYLHYNDPHYPYEPVPGYARFGATIPDIQITGETKRAFYEGRLELTRRNAEQLVDLYDGEIRYTDDHIRRLVEGIESLGYGNLRVIVTADHGEEFLEHAKITHGQSLYEELIRVPLVISGGTLDLEPGRGRRVKEAVQVIDLMPTIIALDGLRPPAGIQGNSLSSLMAGDEPGWGAVFSERMEPAEMSAWNAVSDGRWKLIHNPGEDIMLFFDLIEDPHELSPIQGTSRDRERLTAEITAWSEANIRARGLIDRSTLPLDEETEKELKSLGYVN